MTMRLAAVCRRSWNLRSVILAFFTVSTHALPKQWSLSYEEALRNELRRGVEVVESGETVDGATSFARGQGRHGAF